jgi:hypothetical protein
MTKAILIAAVGILLPGCTTYLSTSPGLRASAERKDALKGVPYSLPMLQYEIALTRTLSSCPNDAAKTELVYSVKADATARYVGGESYEVDYATLSSPLKSSSFAMEFHDRTGTLKSINASATDHTADIIKDVVKTGLSIASVGAGVGKASLESSPKVTYLQCTPEAAGKLAEFKANAARIEKLTDSVDLLTRQITSLTQLAALKIISAKDKRLLAEKMAGQNWAMREIARLSAANADIEKALSAKQTLFWPRRFDETQAVLPPSEASLAKLAALVRTSAQSTDVTPCAGEEDGPEACLATQLSLGAMLETAETSLPDCGSPAQPDGCMRRLTSPSPFLIDARDGAPDRGVFIRQPAEGRLRLVAADPAGGNQPVLEKPVTQAPQLGQLRFLPFVNKAFQNNALVLLVRENGAIEKVEYSDKDAIAKTISGTVADVAGQIDTALEKREEERRSDAKYAREQASNSRADQIADIQFEIDQLTKQKELLTAQTPNPNAAVEAETKRINTELALLNARIAQLKAEAEFAALTVPK